jgi:hypothetical protein
LLISLGRSRRSSSTILRLPQRFKAFFNDIFGNVQLHSQIGLHPLKPRIFLLQLFDPPELRGFLAAIPLVSFVQTGFAYPPYSRIIILAVLPLSYSLRMPAIRTGQNVLFFIFYSFKVRNLSTSKPYYF